MVLRVPDTGLHLESSAKAAETLPLQAFAFTLSDNVIENLIQCVQNGEDVRLSLGNVPSFLYGTEVHKISKASETTDLDLFLTDPSESTEEAERLPHPTMSLFMKPPTNRYPRLAQGREVVREKKTFAASRKAKADLPDDMNRLKEAMEQAKNEKMENSTKIVSTPLGAGTKRGPTKGTKSKFLPTKATPGLSGTISRSGAASPALSGIVSPSLNPTLSAAEQAPEIAKELRAPMVHELAVREMSFEELRAKWRGDDDKEFKTVLDTVADFDKKLQKYTLKRAYWKEIDAYKYDYDSDDDRQTAIGNAIRNFDRLRLGATDPLWDKLNPKEERGKGKCLSKLLPKLAKAQEKPAAATPQIRVNDASDSSGSKNGDGSQCGVEKKKPAKKASEPMSRTSSQTKQPTRKIEKKWVGKKTTAPKVSPTKAAAAKPTKDKNGRVLSKEFVSDSDSSSEDTPLSATVPRAKALEKEKSVEKEREEREKEREKLREEKEKERERQREREQEIEREKEREKDRELERQREREQREREQREREREQREREREREREKDRLAEKQKEKEKREALKPKPRQPVAKDSIKAQVYARPAPQKRSRGDDDDDSSSSSGTPLSKRNTRETKAAGAAPPHSAVSYKRPPSDYSSHSSRSNSYAANGYSKNKGTSPTKSSPLASSPPTNASDLEDRDRDLLRGRSMTVANGNINVKKRKTDSCSTDGDAERKRQRLSSDLLNDARLFKKFYEVYQKLHYELKADKNFSKEKYETLIRQRKRLENMKEQIYSQIPHEVC